MLLANFWSAESSYYATNIAKQWFKGKILWFYTQPILFSFKNVKYRSALKV